MAGGWQKRKHVKLRLMSHTTNGYGTLTKRKYADLGVNLSYELRPLRSFLLSTLCPSLSLSLILLNVSPRRLIEFKGRMCEECYAKKGVRKREKLQGPEVPVPCEGMVISTR